MMRRQEAIEQAVEKLFFLRLIKNTWMHVEPYEIIASQKVSSEKRSIRESWEDLR